VVAEGGGSGRWVSERTAAKWVARFKTEGEAGLLDRSSAPKRIPRRTPADRVESIKALRRLRMTAAEIAEALAMPFRRCRCG
jgi:transposase